MSLGEIALILNPLLLVIVAWFIKRHLDESDAEIKEFKQELKATTAAVAANHADMRERFHDIRNVINSVQAAILKDFYRLDDKFEATEKRVEDRHAANQGAALQVRDDIIKINQTMSSVLQGNIEIQGMVRGNSGKVVLFEQYMHKSSEEITGLKSRVDTLEREVHKRTSSGSK